MWYNKPMTLFLRSPLHPLISQNVMLITYTGRRSGKRFSTPVNHARMGNDLMVVSFRNRTWWRNLRGGAALSVLLGGARAQGGWPRG